jgi:hypothetical protein
MRLVRDVTRPVQGFLGHVLVGPPGRIVAPDAAGSGSGAILTSIAAGGAA